MEIFVTGATGVLGRAMVPLLLSAGHRVRGLARSANNDALLRQLGAEPVAVDLADAAGLRATLTGCDAVLHLATKIPPSSTARKGASWRENDRLRREGTNALVDAALAAGVPTLLYPSVTLLYPDSGERWLVAGESTPDPTPNLRSTIVAEEAIARFTAVGGAVKRPAPGEPVRPHGGGGARAVVAGALGDRPAARRGGGLCLVAVDR